MEFALTEAQPSSFDGLSILVYLDQTIVGSQFAGEVAQTLLHTHTVIMKTRTLPLEDQELCRSGVCLSQHIERIHVTLNVFESERFIETRPLLFNDEIYKDRLAYFTSLLKPLLHLKKLKHAEFSFIWYGEYQMPTEKKLAKALIAYLQKNGARVRFGCFEQVPFYWDRDIGTPKIIQHTEIVADD